MNVLNQLQNFRAAKRSGIPINARTRTEEWIKLLKIEPCLRRTKFVHIAGTKGKGTTCLYTETLVHQWASQKKPDLKIACVTSPHVSSITERIRLNSRPIADALFTEYVKRLWQEMEVQSQEPSCPPVPAYPGFMTLLGFFIIHHEEIDIAIIETGIGGETDSTNVIPRPCATGITTIDLDHVNVLGADIASIAWHKSGIFKPQCPAFTVPQKTAALEVLQARSREQKVAGELVIVSEDAIPFTSQIVHPNTDYQRLNAALAVQLAVTTIRHWAPEFDLSIELLQTLKTTELIGRNEIVNTPKNTWLLNIAHNELSVSNASQWFNQVLTACPHNDKPIVLLFNHHSHRSSLHLLEITYNVALAGIEDRVLAFLLSTNCSGIENEKPDFIDPRRDMIRELKSVERHADFLESRQTTKPIHKYETVLDAIIFAENTYSNSVIVIAGSLYLVGAARHILLSKCQGGLLQPH